MEVASPPMALPPAPRHSRCSPMLDSSSHKRGGAASTEEERSAKRCRFVMDVDALSEDFSSHSLFYKNNGAPIMSVATAAGKTKTGTEFGAWNRKFRNGAVQPFS